VPAAILRYLVAIFIAACTLGFGGQPFELAQRPLVPNFIGLTREEASTLGEKSHLRTTFAGPSSEDARVKSQSRNPGTAISDDGLQILLQMAVPPAAIQVQVPNFEGKKRNEATAMAIAYGLSPVFSGAADGRISSQSPAAGTRTERGAQVELELEGIVAGAGTAAGTGIGTTPTPIPTPTPTPTPGNPKKSNGGNPGGAIIPVSTTAGHSTGRAGVSIGGTAQRPRSNLAYYVLAGILGLTIIGASASRLGRKQPRPTLAIHFVPVVDQGGEGIHIIRTSRPTEKGRG
jgi:hypothetical protein